MHRIGRTARAGADGIAISFCDAEERAFLRDIEKLIRISIPATDRRSDKRAAPTPRSSEAAPANRERAPDREQPRRASATAARTASRRSAADGRSGDAGSPTPQRPKAGARIEPSAASRRAEQKPARGREPAASPRRAARAAHDIGAVAFMQQPRREQHRQAGARPSRHAPR